MPAPLNFTQEALALCPFNLGQKHVWGWHCQKIADALHATAQAATQRERARAATMVETWGFKVIADAIRSAPPDAS